MYELSAFGAGLLLAALLILLVKWTHLAGSRKVQDKVRKKATA